ncbi:MAG: hypothetical protein ACRDOM_07215, partial [Nocardioides sp.]
MRARWLVVGVVVLVISLVVAGALWWRSAQLTDLQRAVADAPPGSERLTWTDWAAVRTELGADLDTGSSVAELEEFLADGFEADLTSSSTLLTSAATLHQRFGFSPATLEWELFSQGPEGAAILMRLPESTDFDQVGDRLASLGYDRPTDEEGIFEGGGDTISRISNDLTPELQHLALDPDRQLVVASDDDAYLQQALDTVRGDGDQLEGYDELVEATGEPLSGVVYSGGYTCSALAMGSAAPDDQAQADELVEAAGEVNPVTGFSMSVQPDRDVRVVLGFENDEQAVTNADSRAILARGPAPGQGGEFGDRFAVDSVTAE